MKEPADGSLPDDTATVSTRRAGPSDLTAILDMVCGLAADHGDTALVDLTALTRDLTGPHPWAIALVAEADDDLVGYAALLPLYRLQLGQRGMDLHHLYVKPPFRSLGVGEHLVDAAKAEATARGCTYMTVGTHADNVRAHRLYERLGFEHVPASGPRFRLTLNPPDR